MCICLHRVVFFVFKQKTAYEWRISDWSSDVCSSDLGQQVFGGADDASRGIFADLQRLRHRVRRAAERADRSREFLIAREPVAMECGKPCLDMPDAIAEPPEQRFARCLLVAEPRGEPLRSEERRVGKECVSKCRSRWASYH